MKIIISILMFSTFLFSQDLTNDLCDDDNENLPCCFINMPKELSHRITIADRNEPGERMYIKGAIYKSDHKTPYANVILYAYHTNEKGIYPKNGNEVGIHKWHGYLHSWGRTNQKGEFEINTIRPAQYPSRTIPAHIHIVVKEPNGRTYYSNDIMFADDNLVKNKNEEGVITVSKNNSGVWEGSRIIYLK